MLSNYPDSVNPNDPSAPWNQKDTPELTFRVAISQSLSKITYVTTNDYIEGEMLEDADRDGDGNWFCVPSQEPPNTSDTDWNAAYSAEHYTPLRLIAELKRIKEIEAGNLKARILMSANKSYNAYLKRQLKRVQHIISECEGWIEDECEIVKD